MSDKKKKRCPPNLGPDARRYWKWAVGFFDVPEEKLALLEGTAINWGLFKECERVLAKEGYMVKSVRGFKQRAEIAVMKNSWVGYCQGAKLLGLFEDEQEPKKQLGRPPDRRWSGQVKSWER